MKLSLSELSADGASLIRARLVRLLAESGYPRRRYRELVVCLTPEGDRCVLRAQLATEFWAAGLGEAAHEVMARRIGPGQFLTWIVRDHERGAGAAFVVVDLGARR